jgi:hypothetical protein
MAECRARPSSTLVVVVVCAAFSLTQGCARSSIAPRTEVAASSPTAQQNLPFHQASEHATDDSVHPAVPPDAKPLNAAPFPAASHPHSLPAGTLITVRLEKSLSISRVHAGDTFTATVADPLTFDGDTLIAAGTPVTGRVEFAQPAVQRVGSTSDPGYLGLILEAISVDGRGITLQTSSLFTTGTLRMNRPSGTSSSGSESGVPSNPLRIRKGRRLTFRLTAPVAFPDANSIAKR